MKIYQIIIFALLTCCVMFGCTRQVRVKFDIENPRKLGEQVYVTMDAGKIRSIGNGPSDGSIPVLDYRITVLFILELQNGKYTTPTFYNHRKGFMFNVYFEPIDEKRALWPSYQTRNVLAFPKNIKKCYLIVRSRTEETGWRVHEINWSDVEIINGFLTFKVPDILSLKSLKESSGNKTLMETLAVYKPYLE